MLGLLTIISMFYNTKAHGIGFGIDVNHACDDLAKDFCLENYFCKWCNVSVDGTPEGIFEESCSVAENICSSNFNESSLCIYNEDYDNYCRFFSVFYNMIILFILCTSTYSISYSIISNLSENTKHNNLLYVFIITLLVNIPAFILWGTYSHYFLFYLFSLILISFLSCLGGSTKKYVKYRNDQKKIQYQRLN